MDSDSAVSDKYQPRVGIFAKDYESVSSFILLHQSFVSPGLRSTKG